MRPIRLEFQAFGSYPGKEVVDFDVLGRRGLFLVTGPTGSGKTTVFDAMVFALYNVLPGSRGVGAGLGPCRSHFAEADVETYVQFTFEVDGVRHTVRRSPAQQRPKKKGSGTTLESASASVVRHRPNGDEPLATKADEASKVCAAVLGIDAGQFQRVVLLPQGKFTDFLVAGDDDRERLLRPLFGTEIYKRATEMLNETVKQLGGQVQKVQEDASHHRRNAQANVGTARRLWLGDEFGTVDPEISDDDLGAMILELEPERGRRAAHLASLQGALQQATEERTAAQGAQQRFDDAARHAATLERLEAERETVGHDRNRAVASSAARPVTVAAAAVHAAQERLEAATAERDAVESVVRSGFEGLGVPVPVIGPATVAAAVHAIATEVTEQRKLLGAASAQEAKAAGLERDLETARTTLAAAVEHLGTLTRRADELQVLAESLEPSAARLEVLEGELRVAEALATAHGELLDAQRLLGEAIGDEAAARAALDDVMQRFIATQAPLLAEQLEAGRPCAVCGSTEHPAPARHLDGKVTDHKEVEKAQRRHSVAGGAVASAAATVEGLRTRLGADADQPADHFDRAIGVARGARDGAAEAGDRLAKVRDEQQSLTDATSTARTRVDGARTAVDTLTGSANEAREEADRLAGFVMSIDADQVEARASVVDELSSVAERLAGVFAAVATAEGGWSSARTALDGALATSGFGSVDDAAAALLPVADEQQYMAAAEGWGTAQVEASAALTTLRAQGIPDERPDVSALEAAEKAAGDAVDRAGVEYTTAANALAAATTELAAAQEVTAGAADLQRRYDTARAVHRTCNGDGPFKVKMERWVLSAELGRVTDAANVHLARMTSHRFALQRDEAKGGLGLVVSDTHSGTTRPTTSLSGGEQFQASLSLALGLADVVSMGGTGAGRTFEALFVDEGFGSLDPQALDQAIDALGHLHATGRMVGAITHVEAMKQSLHVGIEVSRLADGGSTLVVHP